MKNAKIEECFQPYRMRGGGATIILAPPPSTRKLHNPKNVEQWQLPFIFLYELLPKNINENRWFWHVTSLNETFIAISWRKNPKLLRVYWAPENNVLLLQRGGIGQSTGCFLTPPPPEKVSRLAPPKKCLNCPPLNLVSMRITLRSSDT